MEKIRNITSEKLVSLDVYSNVQAVATSPGWAWRGEVILSLTVEGKNIRNIYTHVKYSKIFPSNDVDGEYNNIVDSEYDRIHNIVRILERECEMDVNLGKYNYLL